MGTVARTSAEAVTWAAVISGPLTALYYYSLIDQKQTQAQMNHVA